MGCSTRKLRELFATNGIARPAPDVARIEEVVKANMRSGNAGIGIRKIVGELVAERVPFSWATVAEIMRTVDPVGRDLRYRRAVPRVQYNVRVANGMWHFDGYEHLATWKICACWYPVLQYCTRLRVHGAHPSPSSPGPAFPVPSFELCSRDPRRH